MKSLQEYREIALQVSNKVGVFLVKEFGSRKEMFQKSESHFGIADDKRANRLYADFLKIHTPEVQIYSEEGEQHLDESLHWIIDPIEGTSNYRVGNPFFATQICLIQKFEPVVSVVYAPKLDLLFTAVKGEGSTLNGEQIKVADLSQLQKAVVSINKGTRTEDKTWFKEAVGELSEHIRTWRMFGSMGLELAFLSSGIIDVFINSGSNFYDYAPGVLLVREAGGVVINHTGADWKYKDKSLIASNEILAGSLTKLLK